MKKPSRHKIPGRETPEDLSDTLTKLINFDADVPPVIHPEPPKRGGAGRGQGRKPSGDEKLDKSVHLRLSSGQRSKLEKLGGAIWLRKQIDASKITKKQHKK